MIPLYILQIGDKIVVLNRIRQPENNSITYYPKTTWCVNNRNVPDDGRLARIDLAARQPDKDDNVNGKRGTLRNHKREADDEDDIVLPGHSSSNSNNISRESIKVNWCFIAFIERVLLLDLRIIISHLILVMFDKTKCRILRIKGDCRMCCLH